MERLLEELRQVRRGSKLETVHFCKNYSHLWVVRVLDHDNSYIVWTWNTQSSGLCHGAYDCSEASSWDHFREKILIYG